MNITPRRAVILVAFVFIVGSLGSIILLNRRSTSKISKRSVHSSKSENSTSAVKYPMVSPSSSLPGLLSADFTCPSHLLSQREKLIRGRNGHFKSTRAKLVDAFKSVTGKSNSPWLILLHSGSKVLRDPIHGDMHHPFEPSAHFQYVSDYGLYDSDPSVVLIENGSRFILFRTEPHESDSSHQMENFFGRKMSRKEVESEFYFDQVLNLAHLGNYLNSKNAASEIHTFDVDFVQATSSSRLSVRNDVLPIAFGIASSVKTPSEIEYLKYSSQVTRFATERVISELNAKSAGSDSVESLENHLVSYFNFLVQSCGSCHRLAYPSIVARGEHALTLEYSVRELSLGVRNNEKANLSSAAWILDMGAQCFGYSADTTNTIYQSPSKSPLFQKIDDRMKRLLRETSEFAVAGNTLELLNEKFSHLYFKALEDLDLILPGSTMSDELEAISMFMGHSLFHPIGLVVHDRSANPVLLPGMVLALEPGFYLFDSISAFGRLNETTVKAMKDENIFAYRYERMFLIGQDGNTII